MNTKKIVELDILRAISALAVITIHVCANFTSIPVFNWLQLSMAYIDNLSGFAVPSFIFISGLVLYSNYNSIDTKVMCFYRKRFLKIVPIYLLFSLGYSFFNLISNWINAREIHFDPIILLYQLITGGTFYHLWYFGILFQFYLCYPIFLKLYKKYQLKLVLISFFIQLLWNYFGINLLNNFGKILGQDNFSFPFLFSHIFWFVSGFYFLENKDKITSKINIEIGIILILILNIVRTMPLYYGLQLFKYKDIPADYFYIITAINPFFYAIEILVVYKIALLILNEKAKISNLLKKIGDYSLEIYLIHALVITILNNILRGINISPEILLFYPILWIGSVFISAAFALIYRKMETRLKKVVLLNNN